MFATTHSGGWHVTDSETAALKITEIVSKYAPKRVRDEAGSADPAPSPIDLPASRLDALISALNLEGKNGLRQTRDRLDGVMRAMDEMADQLRKDLRQLGDLSSQAVSTAESMDTSMAALLALCKVPVITTVLPPAAVLKKN